MSEGVNEMNEIKYMSDQDLLVTLFTADAKLAGYHDETPEEIVIAERSVFAISAELDRRFGDGASDRLVDFNTGWHMTHDEMIAAARTTPEAYIAVMRQA